MWARRVLCAQPRAFKVRQAPLLRVVVTTADRGSNEAVAPRVTVTRTPTSVVLRRAVTAPPNEREFHVHGGASLHLAASLPGHHGAAPALTPPECRGVVGRTCYTGFPAANPGRAFRAAT